jgi:hypothetical protein
MHQKEIKRVYMDMEQELRKTFKENTYNPELKLSDDIWRSIVIRQRRKITINTISNILATSFFVALFVPIIEDLTLQFTQSGFYNYMSLLFSDTHSVTLYWKEFMLSLADSLPMTNLILSAGLIFIILLFIRRTITSFKSPFVTT